MKQIKPVNELMPGSDSSSELNCFHIDQPSVHKEMVQRDSIETFGPQSVSPSFALAADSSVDMNSL